MATFDCTCIQLAPSVRGRQKTRFDGGHPRRLNGQPTNAGSFWAAVFVLSDVKRRCRHMFTLTDWHVTSAQEWQMEIGARRASVLVAAEVGWSKSGTQAKRRLGTAVRPSRSQTRVLDACQRMPLHSRARRKPANAMKTISINSRLDSSCAVARLPISNVVYMYLFSSQRHPTL